MNGVANFVIEAICYSGLEGLKLSDIPALFTQKGPYRSFPDLTVDDDLLDYVINCIRRSPLISIFSVDENVDNYTTYCMKSHTQKLMKFFIYDRDRGIKGFCRFYHIRQNINLQLASMEEPITLKSLIERFGDGLYAVADQKTRQSILHYHDFLDQRDPVGYCVLELIGIQRERGLTQAQLLQYGLESMRTCFVVGNLTSKKLIIKINHGNNYEDLPPNVLILPKFYNPDTLHMVYHLIELPDIDVNIPYYVASTFKIVKHHEITIHDLFFQISLSHPQMSMMDFKNVFLCLILSNVIEFFFNGVIITKGRIYNYLPRFGSKRMALDYTMSAKWMTDSEDEFWQFKVIFIGNKLFSFDVDAHADSNIDRNNFLGMQEKSFNMPAECSPLAIAHNIVGSYKNVGCSMKDWMTITRTDHKFGKRILNHAIKWNLIQEKNFRVAKYSMKRFFSTRFEAAKTAVELHDTNDSIIMDSQECIINVQAYIDKYVVGKAKRKIYFDQQLTVDRLKFVVNYMLSQNGVLTSTEDLLNKFSEREKNLSYAKTNDAILARLIRDLELVKIIKRMYLKVLKRDKETIVLQLYAIFTDDYKTDWDDISGGYLTLLSPYFGTSRIKTSSVKWAIIAASSSSKPLDLAETLRCHVIKGPERTRESDDGLNTQLRKLLLHLYTASSSMYKAFPKFFRCKLLHVFLFMFVYGDKVEACPEFDKNRDFSFEDLTWIWSMRVTQDEKSERGWFNTKAAILSMPLIVFLVTSLPAVKSNNVMQLITEYDDYLLPMSNVFNTFSDDLQKSSYTRFTDNIKLLFILRLVGVTLNSLNKINKKNNYFLLNSMTIETNDASSDFKTTYEFNSINDILNFWQDFEEKSLMSKQSTGEVKSPICSRFKIFSCKKYASVHTTDRDKLVVCKNDETGPLGFPAILYLNLYPSWRISLKDITKGPSNVDSKSKTSASPRKKKKQLKSSKSSVVFISSPLDLYHIHLYILCRFKNGMLKDFVRDSIFFHQALNKPNLPSKTLGTRYTQIHYSQTFRRLIKKITDVVKSQQAYESLKTLPDSKQKSIELYQLIASAIANIGFSCDITSPSFTKRNEVEHLTMSTKILLSQRIQIANTNSDRIDRCLLAILSLIFKASIYSESPTSVELEKIYNSFGFNYSVDSMAFLKNFGYFRSFNRSEIFESMKNDNFDNLLNIYEKYFARISMRITHIYQRHDLFYLPPEAQNFNIMTNTFLFSFIHYYLQSKIQIHLTLKTSNDVESMAIHLLNFNLQSVFVHQDLKDFMKPEKAHIIISPSIVPNPVKEQHIIPLIVASNNCLNDISTNISSLLCQKHGMSQSDANHLVSKIFELLESRSINGKKLEDIISISNSSSFSVEIVKDCMALFVFYDLVSLEHNMTYFYKSPTACHDERLFESCQPTGLCDIISGEIDQKLLNNMKKIVYGYIYEWPGVSQDDIINELGKVFYDNDLVRVINILKDEGCVKEIQALSEEHCLFQKEATLSNAFFVNVFS